MRLLILGDGLAPHTRRWAEWFGAVGLEVHVVSFNSENLEGYESSRLHVLWSSTDASRARPAKMAVLLRRLRTLVRTIRPDLIHAHSAGGYAWAAAALRVPPYVVTPWGTDLLIDVEASRANRWFTSMAMKRADLVTTDAFFFVDLIEALGVDPKRIEVLNFGTDTAKFRPSDSWGQPRESAPVVISTRTPTPVHDVETLVRSIPEITESYGDCSFTVVGDGSSLPGLKELARQLQVDKQVHFTGMVEENEMRSLLANSDLYVSTSPLDAGLAASTAEAMACGLPVVHADCADNEYWTPGGQGGLLIEPSDPSALSAAVVRILQEGAEARHKLGVYNRERIAAEYDTDKQLGRMLVHYERLYSAYH